MCVEAAIASLHAAEAALEAGVQCEADLHAVAGQLGAA